MKMHRDGVWACGAAMSTRVVGQCQKARLLEQKEF